ncbi:MAG: hypothetical protein K9L59_19100, partial [Desulfobacterales bacterium]|nr:hypothetical protein [Desulfobacterales bacterium]
SARHPGRSEAQSRDPVIPGLRVKPGMTDWKVSPLIKLDAPAASGGAYVKLGQNGIVSPLIKLVGAAGQRRRSYETSVEAGGKNRPIPALGFGSWRATLRRGRHWVIAGNTDATERVPPPAEASTQVSGLIKLAG